MCPHIPPCPSAEDADREAAHAVSSRPEQGWSLLCNGVVVFDDGGEILPSGQAVHPPAVRMGLGVRAVQPAPGRHRSAGIGADRQPPGGDSGGRAQ